MKTQDGPEGAPDPTSDLMDGQPLSTQRGNPLALKQGILDCPL